MKYILFLVSTSTEDFQVPFWGPLKWMAKIRNSSQNSLFGKKDQILHISDSAPHGTQEFTLWEIVFLLNCANSSVTDNKIKK